MLEGEHFLCGDMFRYKSSPHSVDYHPDFIYHIDFPESNDR